VSKTDTGALAGEFSRLIKDFRDDKISGENKFLTLKESDILGDDGLSNIAELSGAVDRKAEVLKKAYTDLDKSMGRSIRPRDYKALAANILKSTGDAAELEVLNANAKRSLDRLAELNRDTTTAPKDKDKERQQIGSRMRANDAAITKLRGKIFGDIWSKTYSDLASKNAKWGKDRLDSETAIAMAVKTNGSNALTHYETELTMANKIASVRMDIADLEKLGGSSIAARAKT
jgi:hypothetical protein